jgi:hypothetical protein
MESPRGFTAIVCGERDCPPATGAPDIRTSLRQAVRACPHGVLVSGECLVGMVARGGAGCPLGGPCHPDRPGAGALVIVQPCDENRHAHGPAVVAGPLHETADVADLCLWLVEDAAAGRPLPEHLKPTVVAVPER